MQRTDPLEEALRGSGFLWRPQPRRRRPLGPGVSAPPPWLRIDEKRLFVYVSEHGAEPQPARVAAIVRKAGGRVRVLTMGSPAQRVGRRVKAAMLQGLGRQEAAAATPVVTVYELPLTFFLCDYPETSSSSGGRQRISARWARRPRGIRVSAPPELRSLIWIDLVLLAVLATAFVLLLTGKFASGSYCTSHSVWCGAAGSVVAALALGAIGVFLFFLHAHRAIRRYLLDVRARARPGWRSAAMLASVEGQHAEELATEIEDIIAALGLGPRPRRVLGSLARIAGAGADSPAAIRVIVGRPGAGKTTLLHAVASELATAGYVPVTVKATQLTDGEQLGALARQELADRLEQSGISGREGERTLQWMSQSGRVVIVADDLHRLAELGHADIAEVVRGATEQRTAVLATARRGSVPPGLEQWAIDIEELRPTSREEIARTTLSLAAVRWQEMVGDGLAPGWPPSPRQLVEDLIARGELHESRFFTAHLLPRLLCASPARSLPALADVGDCTAGEVRSRLLDLYVQAFIDGELRPSQSPVDRTAPELDALECARVRRLRLVEGLEAAALSAIVGQRDVAVDLGTPGAADAARAGLLRASGGGRATLEHAILQSYLASRRLLVRGLPSALVRLAGSAEADDAILLYAGRRDRQAEASVTSERLYAQIGMPDSKGERMRIATTAAEVVLRAQIDIERALSAIGRCWETAEPLQRCEAIARVARMATPEALLFLWSHAQDSDYRVRWAVARGLTDSAFRPGMLYATLGQRIADAFNEAERLVPRLGEVDDWAAEILPLKMLAWTLPALELAAGDEDERERISDDIEHLLWLLDGEAHGAYDASPPFTGITSQLGLEASVAQGFRAAARLAARPARGTRPLGDEWAETLRRLHTRLGEMLKDSQFWYSKMMLAHGLAELRIAWHARPSTAKGSLPDMPLSELVETDHPLLSKAAALADLAVEKAKKHASDAPDPRRSESARARLLDQLSELADGQIWDDEGVAVRAVRTRLSREAQLLLGEVTLLLNLVERGSAEDREQLARRDDLPDCLATGPRGHWRMLGEDWRGLPSTCPGPPQCAFGLCPYQDPIAREPNALRPFSRAFCLQLQRSAATVSGLRPDAAIRSEFWARMADRFSD